jgi:hypothetical protein
LTRGTSWLSIGFRGARLRAPTFSIDCSPEETTLKHVRDPETRLPWGRPRVGATDEAWLAEVERELI